ncbi:MULTISPECIES: glycogen debranching protein GlgX [unclassified Arthrobacter]|uniref:glycogen debranching protein GlgX n=1 Tax=unclassified Arthrobacter TaxID=235627 RepID=UPI00159D8AC1|nr:MULTISPECIES: glycogen debranching protein GlgX [unclassified Arthrobacter]MCQ9165043.1 glycogen debranching protein GlgX [Arthrobacter sp. STN4]NVM98892.1 glycogen debranching protein GlgX [Arthrobacter sp. SDTb3-6]
MPETVVEDVSTLGTALSRRFPLGVTPHSREEGADTVNVAVYAPALEQLVLCFQPPGGAWKAILLPDLTDGVHHGLVWGMPVGSRYGFYAGAPEGPEGNLDPEKVQLLLDPYGRYIDQAKCADGVTRYVSVRMQSGFDWGEAKSPRTPQRNTVMYEAHVRGQTMLHPDIPEEIRGSYAGMAHPVMIEHLQKLGVTAVELLPIHFHIDEPHLGGTGMSNYWGYNTLGYFSPHVQYASAAARAQGPAAVQDELKGMVKLLHLAGIEVILDVVYNHTAEGGQGGPALSWRGLGEEQYYRMRDGGYVDTTGCGNTLNFSNPYVIRMAMDSLRYWVEEFHIDGFRFDLAVSLARDGAHEFTHQHPFLLAAATDGVLSTTKLIAEPWDVGYGGWQTGNFPTGWSDWNDSFRDSVREVWLTDRAAALDGHHSGNLAKFGDALGGSAALFARSGRSPLASVNLVTAHDGFTLADLTAYNEKHNEDNQEGNRDGHGDNRSWNHGVEGITNDPAILSERGRTARNMMATLLLAQGMPLISAGDELGRSQGGNNNAYCQDNEIAWLDWSMDPDAQTMLAATRRLVQLRRHFLSEQPSSYPTRGGEAFIHWFGADGEPMAPERWTNPHERILTMLMGSPNGKVDGLVIFNTGITDESVTLPANPRFAGDPSLAANPYQLRMTTSGPFATDDGEPTFRLPRTVPGVQAGEAVPVEANTVLIFRNLLPSP